MNAVTFVFSSTFAPISTSQIQTTSFLQPHTIQRHTRLAQTRTPTNPHTPQNVRIRPTSAWHVPSFNRGKRNTTRQQSDFAAMSNPMPFIPPLRATVVSVTPISAAAEYIQLVIDVSGTGINDAHTAPGQAIRLANLSRRKTESVSAVISSPPQSGPLLHFMVACATDPCNLATCRPGDQIAVGEVSGHGIDYGTAAENQKNLFLFVDTPQAFAAVRSLIEWSSFRAMTGTGANRTTMVTVYYSLPPGGSIPYSHCFSDWSVFGVNIVPIVGRSILEFLSVQSTLGRSMQSVGSDYAISAVRFDRTHEALFSSLLLLGFRRSAVSKFTEEHVGKHDGRHTQKPRARPTQQGKSTGTVKPPGMPDPAYEEQTRQRMEKEIWEKWVRIRETMRVEFEKKWEAQTRVDKEKARSEAEKQRAWESWSARNAEAWTEAKWDNNVWTDYWRTWQSTGNENGEDAKRRRRAAYEDNTGSERKWNQQDSQEYWDWVGRGNESKKKSSASGSSGHGSSWWSYSEGYGESAGWGNRNNQHWSGYEKGGYKYEYTAGSEQKSKQQKQKGGWGQQGKSRSSAGGTGGERDYSQGWWNNAWSGKQRANQHSSRGSSSYASPAKSIDLYAVLGISSRASRSEIKQAYRRQAMEHHPDKNPGRVEAATMKMQQIVVAWTVLKDDGSRRRYDRDGVGGF